jgi:hypothetical protein
MWDELPIPMDVIDRVDELTANEPEYENDLVDIDDDIEENNADGAGDQYNNLPEEPINECEQDIQPTQPREDEENENMKMELEREQEIEDRLEDVEDENVNQDNDHGYNLRLNRTRDYSHCSSFLSVQAGLKQFGKRGKDAILDELRLFLTEEVFAYIKTPSNKQKKQALRVHCFLTEKRDGRIKARAVADGRSQIRYSEEETYSPIIKLESIMLSNLIDAMEHQYVATVIIKGAFLKAKVPEDMELLVKMDGELAAAFAELNPEFQLDEQGILYLRCLKALYGHIEAARLFYNELNSSLINKMKFE